MSPVEGDVAVLETEDCTPAIINIGLDKFNSFKCAAGVVYVYTSA